MSDKAEREILYHYSNYTFLDNMLSQRTLRVNNILNMNDAAEMRLFMRGLSKAVVDSLNNDGNQKLASKARSLFERELKKEFAYSGYAACFSRLKDDAAQWERYGNGGRGVCIGFQRHILEQMTGGAISLNSVYYQDDMTDHWLVPVFCDLIKKADEEKNKSSVMLNDALHSAWICSAAFKHPSFASENEVRLVVSPFEKEFFDVKPHYHVNTERIKKYYPLDLDSMCKKAGTDLQELITEVIIGPESTQSLPILQDYFNDMGEGWLAERTSVSGCPLRRRR